MIEILRFSETLQSQISLSAKSLVPYPHRSAHVAAEHEKFWQRSTVDTALEIFGINLPMALASSEVWPDNDLATFTQTGRICDLQRETLGKPVVSVARVLNHRPRLLKYCWQ